MFKPWGRFFLSEMKFDNQFVIPAVYNQQFLHLWELAHFKPLSPSKKKLDTLIGSHKHKRSFLQESVQFSQVYVKNPTLPLYSSPITMVG